MGSLRDAKIVNPISGERKANVLDLAGIEENKRNAGRTSHSVNHAKVIEAT